MSGQNPVIVYQVPGQNGSGGGPYANTTTASDTAANLCRIQDTASGNEFIIDFGKLDASQLDMDAICAGLLAAGCSLLANDDIATLSAQQKLDLCAIIEAECSVAVSLQYNAATHEYELVDGAGDVISSVPVVSTVVTAGNGTDVTGAGTPADPYIISASFDDLNPQQEADLCAVVANCPLATLVPTKTANPASVDVGEIVTYSITIQNTSTVDAMSVVASDIVPAGVTYDAGSIAGTGADDSAAPSLTWNVGTILAGQSVVLQYTATAAASGVHGNTVSVQSSTTIASANGSVNVTVNTAAPEMTISKMASYTDVDFSGTVTVGDTVTYSFLVTNTGNEALSNITITDPDLIALGGTLSGGPIASLAVGASDGATYSGSLTLTQAHIDAGEVSNQATGAGTAPSGPVTANSDDPTNPAGTEDPTVLELPESPDFELVKTGVANGANEGDTVDYTFTFTNTGNVTLTNLTVTDALPMVFAGNPIASLAVGASASVTGVYTITASDALNGSVANTATGTATTPSGGTYTEQSTDTTGGLPGTPTVTPFEMPQIAVQKVGVLTPGSVESGLIPDWTTNGSNLPNGMSVTRTDTGAGSSASSTSDGKLRLVANASGTLFTQVQLSQPASTVVTHGQDMFFSDIDGMTITRNDGGVIIVEDPNGELVGVSDGDVANSISFTSVSASNIGTSTWKFTMPGLTDVTYQIVNGSTGTQGLDFTHEFNNVIVNPEICFDITVENTGDVDLSNVEVNGPAGSIGNLGLLPVGATDSSLVGVACFNPTQAEIDAGEVTVQCSASGTSPSGTVVTDLSDDPTDLTGEDDPTIVDIAQTLNGELIKLGQGPSVLAVNDVIVYNFILCNTGNTAITSATAVDSLGLPLVFNVPIAPGECDVQTASYTVTASDAAAGVVTNNAAVDIDDASGNGPITIDSKPKVDGNPGDPTIVGRTCTSATTDAFNLCDGGFTTFELRNAGGATIASSGSLAGLNAALAPSGCTATITPSAAPVSSAVARSGFAGWTKPVDAWNPQDAPNMASVSGNEVVFNPNGETQQIQMGALNSNFLIDWRQDWTLSFQVNYRNTGPNAPNNGDGIGVVFHATCPERYGVGGFYAGTFPMPCGFAWHTNSTRNGSSPPFTVGNQPPESAILHLTGTGYSTNNTYPSSGIGNVWNGAWRSSTISWNATTKTFSVSGFGAVSTVDDIPVNYLASDFSSIQVAGSNGGAFGRTAMRNVSFTGSSVDMTNAPQATLEVCGDCEATSLVIPQCNNKTIALS